MAGVFSTAVGGMYNYETSSVVRLTSDNFRSMVLDSKETWYAWGALRLTLRGCSSVLLQAAGSWGAEALFLVDAFL